MEEKRKVAQKQGKDAIDEDDPEKVSIIRVHTCTCTAMYIYSMGQRNGNTGTLLYPTLPALTYSNTTLKKCYPALP